MNSIRVMGCLVVTLWLFGCQTINGNYFDGANTQDVTNGIEPLELKLELKYATEQKLEFVATLSNTSTNNLSLIVPKQQSPLTVLVWSLDSHNLTHRITKRLKSDYSTRYNTDLAAGDSIVIFAEVDLTQYKDAIKANERIFVSAQYGQIDWKNDFGLPSLVYSNRIYLERL